MSQSFSAALQLCKASVLSARRFARDAGLSACFVDEDWILRNASPEEISEWMAYEDALVEEVLHSSSPTSIIYSDIGEYDWVTPFFKRAVHDRERKIGPVHRAFSRSETRHLVELCVALQRHSLMLERGTSWAVTQSRMRDKAVRSAQFHDLQLASASQGGPFSIEKMSFSKVGEELVLTVDAEPAETGTRVRCECRILDESGCAKEVWIKHALPDRYNAYDHYSSDAESLLCAVAWKCVTRAFVAVANSDGWMVRIERAIVA